jgi:hypothetical protein
MEDSHTKIGKINISKKKNQGNKPAKQQKRQRKLSLLILSADDLLYESNRNSILYGVGGDNLCVVCSGYFYAKLDNSVYQL